MKLLEQLREKYAIDEPFLSEDIKFNNLSQAEIEEKLDAYTEETNLRKYDDGIYYFSEKWLLGDSLPSPDDVMRIKYLERDGEPIGYYAGYSLLNRTGMTTQVPNTYIIKSNVAEHLKCNSYIAGFEIVVSKPEVAVTADNVNTLQFLEIINCTALCLLEENKDVLIQFINHYGLTKAVIDAVLPAYSQTVKDLLIESGVYNELT